MSFLPALTVVLTRLGWNILSMKAISFANKEEAYVTYARLERDAFKEDHD